MFNPFNRQFANKKVIGVPPNNMYPHPFPCPFYTYQWQPTSAMFHQAQQPLKPKPFHQPQAPVQRVPIKKGDIQLEPGYEIEAVVVGLTFPSSLTFDSNGTLYIGESGFAYGPAKSEGGGRILRINKSCQATEIFSGFRGPVTGVTWHNEYFYVAEGAYPGRILRVSQDGRREILVDGLPTAGDHYTSNIVFGPDGKMYFGVGTLTNSAVVGIDNYMYGWLAEHPGLHDIPPRDYVLKGNNYKTINPFELNECQYVETGAFHAFGKPSKPGEVVKGKLKSNGVIYRSNPDGSALEHYADGFRNPFALKFSPQGKLITVDQGYDARGSRPIANAPDPMWEVQHGGWYGFPDFVAGIPVNDPMFKPEGKDIPEPVLAEHPPVAETLITTFEPHAAAMKFDFSISPKFGYAGDAFVALFGSIVPVSGTVEDHPGHRVVRVNTRTGKVYDFLIAHRAHQEDGHPHGKEATGPVRPIDIAFDPSGEFMYLLDFGRMQANKSGLIPWAQSGILWRISKKH